jgi:hypothetical protein
MTEHNPGDLVGVFADKIQLEVTTDHADQRNSYRTITTTPDGDGTATVTIEGDYTYFSHRGGVFLFDRVEYRPNSDHRTDGGLEDGLVKLTHPDGFPPEDGHPLDRLSVTDFADMVSSGELSPTTDPNSTHD